MSNLLSRGPEMEVLTPRETLESYLPCKIKGVLSACLPKLLSVPDV